MPFYYVIFGWMKKMYNYLKEQEQLFAFNIWDINSAKAVIDGAAVKNRNIILQTSSAIYEQLPQKRFMEFVKSYSKDMGINCWLHLDHCRNMEMIKSAIRNGWDSIMLDASDKSIEENSKLTNDIMLYAHERNVLVEAEIGQIKGIEENIIFKQPDVATQEEIKQFLSETQPDMIAVAFGNAHGSYKGEPLLHFDLLEYTVKNWDIPFVVHGGSGLSDSMIGKLLSIPQVKKINISTDVKLAYRKGVLAVEQSDLLMQDGFQAVKVENCIHDAIAQMVRMKLDLLIR